MELTTENMMVTLSNADDSGRRYTVRGDVYVGNGSYEAVRNGQVYTRDNNTGMMVANFNRGVNESLSINYQDTQLTPEEEYAVMGEIQAFIAAAKTKGVELVAGCAPEV